MDQPHSVLVLVVPHPQGLERLEQYKLQKGAESDTEACGTFLHLNISDLVKGGGEVLYYVGAQRLDVLDLDELEHLENGGVEKVVAVVVGDECVDYRGEEIALDDVSVVELVLEGDDLPHEAQSTKLEEGVSGLDQDQDPSEQVLRQDVIFDVVGVMLDEEAQQFQDEAKNLGIRVE